MTGMDKYVSHVERDFSMKICPELKYMSSIFFLKRRGEKNQISNNTSYLARWSHASFVLLLR